MFLDFLKFWSYYINFSSHRLVEILFVIFECHALVSVLPIIMYFTFFVFLTKGNSVFSWGRLKFREVAVKGVNSTQISNVKYAGDVDVYQLQKQWLNKHLPIVQAGKKIQLWLCHLRGTALERYIPKAVPRIPSP